jgi:hypothetical protein
MTITRALRAYTWERLLHHVFLIEYELLFCRPSIDRRGNGLYFWPWSLLGNYKAPKDCQQRRAKCPRAVCRRDLHRVMFDSCLKRVKRRRPQFQTTRQSTEVIESANGARIVSRYDLNCALAAATVVKSKTTLRRSARRRQCSGLSTASKR